MQRKSTGYSSTELKPRELWSTLGCSLCNMKAYSAIYTTKISIITEHFLVNMQKRNIFIQTKQPEITAWIRHIIIKSYSIPNKQNKPRSCLAFFHFISSVARSFQAERGIWFSCLWASSTQHKTKAEQSQVKLFHLPIYERNAAYIPQKYRDLPASAALQWLRHLRWYHPQWCHPVLLLLLLSRRLWGVVFAKQK